MKGCVSENEMLPWNGENCVNGSVATVQKPQLRDTTLQQNPSSELHLNTYKDLPSRGLPIPLPPEPKKSDNTDVPHSRGIPSEFGGVSSMTLLFKNLDHLLKHWVVTSLCMQLKFGDKREVISSFCFKVCASIFCPSADAVFPSRHLSLWHR